MTKPRSEFDDVLDGLLAANLDVDAEVQTALTGSRLLADAQVAASLAPTYRRRGRRRRRAQPSRSCVVCGAPFVAKRSDARYCSATCRKRASRAGLPRWRVDPGG
jgi:hypothetical protein